MSWPDGGMIPFRGEKNTTWEGGFRVPMMVKWPGKIKPGQVSNEIISMEDWLPTFLAAAGDSKIKEKLLKGHKAGKTTYKVHLDGYNFYRTSLGGRRRDHAKKCSILPTMVRSPLYVMEIGSWCFQSSEHTALMYGRNRWYP